MFEGLDLKTLFSPDLIQRSLKGIILFVAGYVIVKLLSIIISRLSRKYISKQSTMIVHKIILYLGMCLVFIAVLKQFGVQLTALLGAAGIIGIALGFASQTSVSNIISGIFLIAEKPFEVGDILEVGSNRGMVLSIDLLSIKLRTFDNQLIRIPNENLIKTDVKNITRFPIRRADIKLGVAYKEDIRRVLDVLKDIADNNHYILDEPEPFIIFDGFGDSALNITYGVWFSRDEWVTAKKQIMIDIKERFDKEGIEIPFPHRTIYAGSVSEPLPVNIIKEK